MEQRTDEWFAARAGKVTASRINDVLATVKSGESAACANYRAELVAERLTGRVAESFQSAAMKWGTETEPLARAAYEAETGNFVTEDGLIDHPSIPMTGASPDGLVDDDGLIEIKCPNTATHIAWIRAGIVPSEHRNQMLWQMACTGRKWDDFVSFDPRMPPELRIFIVRLDRDETAIADIEKRVVEFLATVDSSIADLLKFVERKNEMTNEQAATSRESRQVEPETIRESRNVAPENPESTKIPSAEITLGKLAEKLGIPVSADYLASIGFVARKERASSLYRESDIPAICAAIIGRLERVRGEYQVEVAA